MKAQFQKACTHWMAALASILIVASFHPVQAAPLKIHSYNALPRPREPMPAGPLPSALNPQAIYPEPDLEGVPYRPLGSQARSQVYTPKASDFRIVDGQLYNIMLSTNWRTLEQWLGVSPLRFEILDKGHDAGLGDWILLNVYKLNLGGDMEYHVLKQVVFKNLAPLDKIAVGENWQSQHGRSMHTGTIETEDHKTLDVYDAGLPNTAENRASLRSDHQTAPVVKTSSQPTKKPDGAGPPLQSTKTDQ